MGFSRPVSRSFGGDWRRDNLAAASFVRMRRLMKPLVPSATTPASVGAPVRLLLFGLLYAAMNLPFAYKYGVRSGLPPWLTVVAYLVGATAMLFLGARLAERDARATSSARWFAAWVGVTAVLLAVLMRRF